MAPPQKQPRPGRQLALLGALFILLGTLVLLHAPSKMSWEERLSPRLGLDLVGGTRVTLRAVTADGNAPNPADLEQARRIIEARVNARGVSEAEVVTEGNANIVISVASQADDAVRDVGQASKLYFRKVIQTTDGSGTAAAPAPTADPSAAPSPNPSPDTSAMPSPEASGQGGGSVVQTPSPSPTATGPATEADVKAKVGQAAWDAAVALTAPATDAAQIALLAPFANLDPEDLGALTPEMQFNIPQISCVMLDARIAASIQEPDKKAVACQLKVEKMYLDVAKVAGTDVGRAAPQFDQTTGQRVVSLDFKSDGQPKWTALTREAFNNDVEPKCERLGDEGRCLVAVVLDNIVISAPQIQGVLAGQSQITGQFSATEAQDLADGLNFGALAVSFRQEELKNVTATLGEQYLRAGLLAAGMGLLLVIIYSFFYYRLLGSVIFLSLILSAILTFGMLVYLGREMGFTLTLAGIAGFIVSLGVAADSFVIYFERLKDEIREGRSPRNAVQRGWIRARKTILTANAITLMAAVILYIISSGPVAGFAFALGLATGLDLLVVFLFRHPIMSLFARTPAFLSPRVSGLGRVLREAKESKA